MGYFTENIKEKRVFLIQSFQKPPFTSVWIFTWFLFSGLYLCFYFQSLSFIPVQQCETRSSGVTEESHFYQPWVDLFNSMKIVVFIVVALVWGITWVIYCSMETTATPTERLLSFLLFFFSLQITLDLWIFHVMQHSLLLYTYFPKLTRPSSFLPLWLNISCSMLP